MAVKFITNKNLIDDVEKYDVVLIGTNTYYRLSNGFQSDMAEKYPYIKELNKTHKYGDKECLGTILSVQEGDDPIISLLYITEGYNFRPDKTNDYLSYESLDRCLRLVTNEFKGKKICMPFLGTSPFDGNGNPKEVIKILRKHFTSCDVTVYDFKQKKKEEKKIEEFRRIKNIKKYGNSQEYYNFIKQNKTQKKKLYLNEKND